MKLDGRMRGVEGEKRGIKDNKLFHHIVFAPNYLLDTHFLCQSAKLKVVATFVRQWINLPLMKVPSKAQREIMKFRARFHRFDELSRGEVEK